jgi:cytochrome c oxidase cbb3-type subunit 2
VATVIVLCAALIESPLLLKPTAADPTAGSNDPYNYGKSLYTAHCAGCHGINGDGRGEVAASLDPKPRDFTTGVYKFRTTPSGQLPTDEDLLRAITMGMPGTSMDHFGDLPEPDRRSMVVFLKTLSPRFARERSATPIVFPSPRIATPEALTRGLAVYDRMQCAACHGEKGRGDGPIAGDLTDMNDQPIRPADLSKPRLKGGSGPAAVYRTVMTGLDGTPMPSYGDSLSPEEGWDLALYVLSLAPQEGASNEQW